MKQIIAMGGGGFSMEPDNPLLDLYILNQSVKKKPKICFLATASGDAEDYIKRFYTAFNKYDCVPAHLPLFKPETRDFKGFIMERDIIYVGGGNTINMLVLWKEWGIDKLLKQAWENGVILAGLSAGSICWFEEGLTDSFGDELFPMKGLGFLKGSHCPHFDGESNRRPSYHRAILSGKLQGGYAADDGFGLHFINDELHRSVSSRKHARGFYLAREDDKIVERELLPMYLGKK